MTAAQCERFLATDMAHALPKGGWCVRGMAGSWAPTLKTKQGTEIKCTFQLQSKGSHNYSLVTNAIETLKDSLRFVMSVY